MNKNIAAQRQQEKKDLLHSEWKKLLDSLNNEYKKLQHNFCPCGCDDVKLPVMLLSIKKKIDIYKKCPCGCTD
jgi:hypothetical protein